MMLALGLFTVPVPGTTVPITTTQAGLDKWSGVHGILVQARPANTGRVFIGTRLMNKTTFAGVYSYLAIPASTTVPSFSAALTLSPAGLKLEDLFLDAEVAGDGAIVTVLVT